MDKTLLVQGTIDVKALDAMQNQIIKDDFSILDNNGNGKLIILKSEDYYVSFVSQAVNVGKVKNDCCKILGILADKAGISRD